jgi:hypothetical protein
VRLKWTCAWAVTLACWLHIRGVASSFLEQPCVGGVAVEVDGVLVQGLRWEVKVGTVIEQYEGQHMRQPTAHAGGSQAAPCLQRSCA